MARPAPRSRRDRPAKPPLSREGIVEAAAEILRTDGFDQVTVRRVAQALDTGPASLYVYVSSTEDLHDEVFDQVLADLEVPDHGTWTDRLERLLLTYGARLNRHRGVARWAMTRRSLGPNLMGLYDAIIGLLLEGGATPAQSAWGADLLVLLVTADAAEHAVEAVADLRSAWSRLQRTVLGADPGVHPHLAAHAALVLGGSPSERDRWMLRAAINGIVAAPAPTIPEES
jgi:AcrR family transcriptional regulator